MFSSPPPLAPPTTEEDALLWLRLIRSPRVGPATFLRLMAEHGSAAAALDALPAIARSAGVDDYRPCPAAAARAEAEAGRRAGARLVALGSPNYPGALAAIADPPPLLWVRGRPEVLAAPAVALVGARSASSLGLRMARALARELGAAGWAVVSGLARGIDAAAHEAALPTGTVAVLAGGIDVAAPPENAALAARIAAEGALVSEQPAGLAPLARHFPRRNRIVAGLARAVVVVEATARSGSLITARCALDQGREVMAVPGHPMDARSAGCNQLIRDGAVLVRGAADVFEALAGPATESPGPERSERGSLPPPSQGMVAPTSPGGTGRPTDPRLCRPAPIRPAGTEAGAAARPASSAGGRGVAAPAANPGVAHAPAAGREAAASGRAAAADPKAPPAGCAQAAGRDRTDRGGSAEAPALPQRILSLLGAAPVAEDQLLRDLRLRAEEIASDLLALELDGLVERRPGGLIARRA